MTRQPPSLIVVVDTEEEFDWSAPFDRQAVSVGHMRHIGRVHEICRKWGIRPVYVVDYPIATQEPAISSLRPLVERHEAIIGAHLHPWVSPPYEEEVSVYNSFPGNLPPALERRKLELLCAGIEASFGVRPTIYKAGRYGIGPQTFSNLEKLGFTVDVSPAPPFDYASEGGPDFSYRGLEPTWEGPRRSILSIPGTGALIGRLPIAGLYRFATTPIGLRCRLPGILSRLGIVERLKLTPEGYKLADMTRLTRRLYATGRHLFMLSLHSPTVEPGNTPYVRSEQELGTFLTTFDGFLQFFTKELQGVPTDPLAFYAATAKADSQSGLFQLCDGSRTSAART